MTDKLDLFIESQRETNRTLAATMEKIADSVHDLEKHTVEVQNLATTVSDHEGRLKQIERSMDFVKGAKHVFIALIIALIIGSAAAVWQVVKTDSGLTKDDAAALIKAIKNANP